MSKQNPRLPKDAFSLLAELVANNNRDWYHEHKKLIKLNLIDPFANILEHVSKNLKRTAYPLQGSRKTMFRLNRDTRFSKNKKPYKENIGGLLTPSGIKNEANGLVYLHLDTTSSMVAAGFYRFSANQLEPLRQRMIVEPKQWRMVKRALFKAELDLERTSQLKSMPRGFIAYSEHEHSDDLKLKNLIVQRSLPKRAWLSSVVVDQVTTFAQAVRPLLQFKS